MSDALLSLARAEYGDELAPVLYALAAIESNFDPLAIGDNGASFGLFQVHRPAWPQLPWPMPATPREQLRFIRPIVEKMVRDGGLANPARWWRHGFIPYLPDPLDLLREMKFAQWVDRALRVLSVGVAGTIGVAGLIVGLWLLYTFGSRRRR